MTKESMTDRALRDTLHVCADQIHVPETLKTRIDTAIKAAPRKQTRTRGKTVLVAVAMLGVLAVSAVAATNMVTKIGHSRNDQVLNYTQALAHAQQISHSVVLPEQFANGFSYQNANDIDSEVTDVSGKTVQIHELVADYQDGARAVSLFVQPADVDLGDEGRTANATRTVGDVTLEYYQTEYKAVPVSYRPTAEEKARVESGTLAIGYGANSVSTMQQENAYMTLNGVRYGLFASDQAIGADEMLEMLASLLR